MANDKSKIRNEIWNLLSEKGVGAFPFPLEGRIPNFKGSNEAAQRTTTLDEWDDSNSVKANPDAPQRKARELALIDGKRLFMAVPRLRDEYPFREIIPGDTPPRKAVTIKGSMNHGKPRNVDDLPVIDLVITGSVAVHPDGRRLGKGGGYSDLEFALLRQAGKITAQTTVVTTVHPLQVTQKEIPFSEHDIPLDYIITPSEIIKTDTTYKRPEGIIPELLSKEYLEEIPVLRSYMGH